MVDICDYDIRILMQNDGAEIKDFCRTYEDRARMNG